LFDVEKYTFASILFWWKKCSVRRQNVPETVKNTHTHTHDVHMFTIQHTEIYMIV